MANPWFRFYAEFQDDAKIQMLPLSARYYFVMLLCSRCKAARLTDAVIAYQWRLPASEVQELKSLFVEHGFIDDAWNVLKWDKRQYVSDSSKDRTQKYRDRHKNVTVTANNGHMQRHRDVPDTDTEADTDGPRNYFAK